MPHHLCPDIAVPIVRMIEQQGSVTFASIMDLPDNRGPCAILGPGNLVLWMGMSEAVADAIGGLRARGVVTYVPATVLDYIACGEVLNLPLALSPESILNGYETPHWAPVAIEPGEAWHMRWGTVK